MHPTMPKIQITAKTNAITFFIQLTSLIKCGFVGVPFLLLAICRGFAALLLATFYDVISTVEKAEAPVYFVFFSVYDNRIDIGEGVGSAVFLTVFRNGKLRNLYRGIGCAVFIRNPKCRFEYFPHNTHKFLIRKYWCRQGYLLQQQ